MNNLFNKKIIKKIQDNQVKLVFQKKIKMKLNTNNQIKLIKIKIMIK